MPPLWTWQTPDFSLLTGRVDHEKSEYVQTVRGVREAYVELAHRLGTDQLIWCYTVSDEYDSLPGNTRVEWVLDVPVSSVLAFVDAIVWNRILGIECGFPRRWELEWRSEAIQVHPDNVRARDRFVDERRRAFWDQPQPKGGWWENLFVDQQAAECVAALLIHPIMEEWVTRNPVVTSS